MRYSLVMRAHLSLFGAGLMGFLASGVCGQQTTAKAGAEQAERVSIKQGVILPLADYQSAISYRNAAKKNDIDLAERYKKRAEAFADFEKNYSSYSEDDQKLNTPWGALLTAGRLMSKAAILERIAEKEFEKISELESTLNILAGSKPKGNSYLKQIKKPYIDSTQGAIQYFERLVEKYSDNTAAAVEVDSAMGEASTLNKQLAVEYEKNLSPKK